MATGYIEDKSLSALTITAVVVTSIIAASLAANLIVTLVLYWMH